MCKYNILEISRWFSVCEEGLHALYHVTASPDKIVGLLLIRLHADLAVADNSHTAYLSRLIFLLGQTALNTLVYTEKIASITKKLLDLQKEQKATSNKRKGKTATIAPTEVLQTPAATVITQSGKKVARRSSIRKSIGGGK